MAVYGFTGTVLHVLANDKPICGNVKKVALASDVLPRGGMLCEPCVHLMSGQSESAYMSRALGVRPGGRSLLRGYERARQVLGLEKSFALWEMDFELSRFLDYRGGLFVEVGANDGIRQSNTYYFEKYRGWRGLLIEAVPELALECEINRPGSTVVEAALVPPELDGREVVVRYANLMSVVRGGMRSREEEDEHIRVGCEIQNTETYEIGVVGKTLTRVLDGCGVDYFDFLSLDVEGYEGAVLDGFDLNRFRPSYILVEARYREDVDGRLKQFYRPVAEYGDYDVLYEVR